MRRAQDLLLAAWVATLGADRVSLLDGLVPFVFTPFLALTPLVVVSELSRHAIGGAPLRGLRPARQYGALAAALLATVFASVTVAHDGATSIQRATLLTAHVAGTLAVALLAADREDLLRLLARAAAAGLALILVADAAQLAALVGALPLELRAGPVAFSLETVPYAGAVPRLSGVAVDPNRTGWAALLFAWMVALGEPSASRRRAAFVVAAVVLVVTLSRSTLMALTVSLALAAVTRRRLRVGVGAVASGALAAGALAAVLTIAPPDASRFEPLAPLAERFSGAEASAGEHALLLARGMEEATRSAPRFLLGLGYGNAYLVLQDRFPDNRYGHFHSLYVSLLAESGVFALLLVVAMLGLTFVRGGEWRPVLAAAILFNVFYQTSAEPSFWFLLALAWTLSESRGATPPRSG